MTDTATHIATERVFDGAEMAFSVTITDWTGKPLTLRRPVKVHIPPSQVPALDLSLATAIERAKAVAIRIAADKYGAAWATRRRAELVEEMAERQREIEHIDANKAAEPDPREIGEVR